MIILLKTCACVRKVTGEVDLKKEEKKNLGCMSHERDW